MARTRLASIWNEEHKKIYERGLLHYARNGDWGDLASYVERHRVDNRVRAFIGAIIRGEKRRPNNRAPTRKSKSESRERAGRVVWFTQIDGMGREAAIDKVADEVGVHRRTVQRDLEKHRHHLLKDLDRMLPMWEFAEEAKQEMPSLSSLLTVGSPERDALMSAFEQGNLAALELWTRRVLMRYEIDETALSQHFMS
jgi:hypothetical protein